MILPQQEVFWHGQQINRMLFVKRGTLTYAHGATSLPDVVVEAGGWALEEALWGTRPITEGPFVAGMGGCDLVYIRAKDFFEICSSCTSSVEFVAHYAESFIHDFNEANEDADNNDLLFNSSQQLQRTVRRAVKQCLRASRVSGTSTEPSMDGSESASSCSESQSEPKPEVAGTNN